MQFTKDKTTYFAEPKTDIKDRIQVEIGDSKQEVFYPQVKIMRWDNESNVSIRLKDSEIGVEKVETKVDKIVWSKGNLEANFYDLNNAEHPEGAYEFDITLKEKPLTNKIEFTLVDKDVDYFYQPALTQAEIDEGASRPENVVGSYAVYAKTQKTNWTGGKEYKCGKIGHIFRPLITDAKGEKVWGDLHIENGLLTVTIPQDFLDSALYPILVDPTFGYTTAGATSTNLGGLKVGSVFTGSVGTGVSISAYIGFDSFNNSKTSLNCSVYLASDLSKLTNGDTETKTFSVNFTDWLIFNFNSVPTFSAVDYWLAIDPPPGNTAIRYDAGSLNQGFLRTEVCGAWPSTLTVDTYNTNKYSIYATYTDSTPLGFNIALV